MAFLADTDSTTSSESSAPRPPTPPRETSREAAVFLKSVLGRSGQSDPHSSLQTPPNATPTSATADSSLKSRRKKVEWSAHTEYKDHFDIRKSDRLTRSSPVSSLSPKPIKGILKQSSSPLSCAAAFGSDLDGSTGQVNIIEMLESTIKQLAGSDRDSKLDAYMMLSRALKASNNLPDRVALQNKMSLFTQFIQRDVSFKTANGSPDTSLTNHALSLLVTFLHFPAIASTLTVDFGIFILDYSIRAFEDAATPKDVMRHLMQVVAFQNFPVKVMTSERVGRLVTTLHQIEDHVTGKSIVMSRIHIYKRLVKQSRSHMAIHLDWLEDMFMDMLSTVKDIRTQAIALATEAGFALRSEKQLMRRASEIFQTVNEEQAYIEFYIQRLDEMLREKSTSAAVPQIWSAMILYMRCPLERWQHYGPWLTLVQSAFNMSDGLTKQEANYAWNRYVFLTLHDTKVSTKALGILCQPLISQLRRKANPKHVEAARLRRTVIGGICNLYYYVFAPGNDRYPPDLLWDVAVQPIMAQLIQLDGKSEMAGDCLMQAARMLAGLLDVTTPRIWKRERIQEIPPVRPDEIPALDAKWIRRNCDKVMKVIYPILDKRFLDLMNKDSITFRLWQVLVGSVAAASAKDIKVSEDTAKFLSCTFGLLAKLWEAGIPGNDESLNTGFLPSVQNFIGVLVDALGFLPFTEKKLSIGPTNLFESSKTPHQSDRLGKSGAVVRTALHHLFLMFCSVPAGGADEDVLADFFVSMFEPFLSGKTRRGRAELVAELLHLLPRDSPSAYGPWLLAAQNLPVSLKSLDDASSSSSADSDKDAGPQYRDIVSLLERGLTAHPNLPADQWTSLFERLSEHVARDVGDAGRSIVLVEPLARTLFDKCSIKSETPNTMSVRATMSLFEVAKFPRDQASLDIVRHRLWGAPLIASATGNGEFEPFEHLCKLGNHFLELFYSQFFICETRNSISPFVASVKDFVTRSFKSSNLGTLSKLQCGLCLWIRDDDSLLQLNENHLLSKSVWMVWREIAAELAGRKRLNRSEVDQIEPLLTAAFQSSHLEIVTSAVETWNALTRDEKSLDCSDSLQSIVSNLGSTVNLATEKFSGGFGAQPSSLPQSQGDVSLVVLSSQSSKKDTQPISAPPVSDSLPTASRRMTRKRLLEATPESARTKSSKRAITPRLRHDDSQIQFAPIMSSSPPAAHDESQHLTEHQQEVRERQRENAALYSDQADTSPIRLLESARKPSKSVANQPVAEAGNETPQRPALYQKLARSTPTPRRGQLLQMDDPDPPSSPPEPRPYPLLSEIQSRLRDKSFMEDWEFSSPPETPAIHHQQAYQTAAPAPTSNDDSSSTKARKTRSSGHKRFEAAASEADVESLGEHEAHAATEDPLPAAEAEQMETRPELTIKPDESPKSVDEEFVDAKSSPDVPAFPPEVSNDDDDSLDTSFALSELDDSCMLKLIVELQAQNHDGNQGQGKKDQSTEQHENIDDGIEMPEQRDSLPPLSFSPRDSPTVPSTPVEPSETLSRSRSKRKRKQPGTPPSGDGGDEQKKRRIDSEGPVEPQATPKTAPQIVVPERSLRRSARKRVRKRHLQQGQEAPKELQEQQRQQEQGAEQQQSPKEDNEEAKEPRRRPGRPKRMEQDVGNTDDEVMSQLMEEAIANSEEKSQSTHSKKKGKRKEVERDETHVIGDGDVETIEVVANTAKDDSMASPQIATEGENKFRSLLDTLQSGLDGLRDASLSRDEVYKMEDMLMDMKRELFAAEKRGRGK